MALSEISYFPSHQTRDKRVKLELLDWLVVADKQKKLYGKIYDIDLSEAELPSPKALISQLNFHIMKHIPRIKQRIFDFDIFSGRVTVNFPRTRYYFTLMMSHQLCVLVGMEKPNQGNPLDFAILGATKPANEYKFKEEDRKFAPNCTGLWKSVESRQNYFKFPPSLSTVNEVVVYCNLVKETCVNTTRAQLLKVFPLHTLPGRISSNFGTNLQFIPLRQNKISEITILLRDWYGAPLRVQEYSRINLIVRPPERASQ